ncbi:hypothetical protein MMYC01_203269 [Madurella mycetomatis]|uniref:DUF7136 domain-containing protein n=1 Tax=Madurella mycetomatis TaxID=100816 RepID=A0A175W989_9PEZI|nr:hypothetical protein MMYC01_203269 [Madurella mycetomatis]
MFDRGCLFALFSTLATVANFVSAQEHDTGVAYPATVELDLVFPRNDTYAPAPVFPVVFAVQNLAAAAPSTSLFIDWSVAKPGDPWLASGTVRLDLAAWANATENPYYVALWTEKLSQAESVGTYNLLWMLRFTNCTIDLGYNRMTEPAASDVRNTTIFTIREGAQRPDFVDGPDNCPVQGLTIEITGTRDTSGFDFTGLTNGHRSICGVVSHSPPPANPCVAKVNAAAASSISAELTASACAGSRPVLTTGCPPPNSAGAAQKWAWRAYLG